MLFRSVIATGPGGAREKLDVRWWTHGGFNQGRNMLTETVKNGPEKLRPFCERLAKKVAEKSEWASLTEVRIVSGQYDRRKYFQQGDHKPIGENTLYSCDVPR
mgnify:FL=1